MLVPKVPKNSQVNVIILSENSVTKMHMGLSPSRRTAPPAAMLLNAINIFTSRQKDGMDGREKVRVWGLRLGTVPGIMSAYERVKRQLPPNLP